MIKRATNSEKAYRIHAGHLRGILIDMIKSMEDTDDLIRMTEAVAKKGFLSIMSGEDANYQTTEETDFFEDDIIFTIGVDERLTDFFKKGSAYLFERRKDLEW